MIQLIEGLPEGVVGLEAVGEVTSRDYDEVTMAIQQALAGRKKIRLLHVFGDRFTGYTAGGMWRDAMLGLTHAISFERIAVVSDDANIIRQVKLGGWLIPGEIRLFSNQQSAEAATWLTALAS